MANNYLITGYWGEPHVTAENDRGIHAAIFGAGRFVLPVGEQFRAEYIGNNTIRLHDGKLLDNGAAAGIPAGEYVDILIPNAGQGKNRNDLIVFQYSQDASTKIETGKFIVIQGEESSGAAADPALTYGDLLSGKATFDQMALWRVPVSGTTIAALEQLFAVRDSIQAVSDAAASAQNTANAAMPKSGGDMTGWIDFGQATRGLRWKTDDGTVFTFRPYAAGNVLQVTRRMADGSECGALNIYTNGRVEVEGASDSLERVHNIMVVPAGTDVGSLSLSAGTIVMVRK